MRERWLGSTGVRVPEIAVEGELDLDDALVLDDTRDADRMHEAHKAGRPIAVRIYARTRASYHPVTTRDLDKLGLIPAQK